MRTRIKICGISNPEAAQSAAQAGADAIGFMFYKQSKRHVEIDQAAAISQSLTPFVSRVGVFVNPDRDQVLKTIEHVKLTYLQFHGSESDMFCRQFNLPYIKAIGVSGESDLISQEKSYPNAEGILLDTVVDNQFGGSGKAFDWKLAHYGGAKPIILAGGLTAENVSEALMIASPYGVDVSSGVETEGKKDIAKITSFCNEVIQFDQTREK